MSQPPKYKDCENQPLTQQIIHRHIHCCPDFSSCGSSVLKMILFSLWGILTIALFCAGIFFASESQNDDSKIDNSVAVALGTTFIVISSISILFGLTRGASYMCREGHCTC